MPISTSGELTSSSKKTITLVCRELLGISERVKEAMFLLLDKGLGENYGRRHDRPGQGPRPASSTPATRLHPLAQAWRSN